MILDYQDTLAQYIRNGERDNDVVDTRPYVALWSNIRK